MLLTILLLCFCVKLWSDLGKMRARLVAVEASLTASSSPSTASASGMVAEHAVGLDHAAEMERRREAREAATAERVRLQSERAAAAAERVRVDARPVRAGFDADPVTTSGGSTLEGLFGRTLPIWGGGLTLAIAGVLVVKWSIDVGLLSPAVRVFLGILFGMGLVAGAEAARRVEVSDERIPQALAGAGVAAVYGAVVAANLLYGLLGDGATMVALVGVTVAIGVLSLRFGAPSAALALAGGLLAPAIVGGEPDLPVLSIYVSMVALGAAWLARVSGSSWLSGAALAGASLWSLVMVGSGPDGMDAAFVGALVLCAGFAVPALSGARAPSSLRAVGVVAAVLQCGALVASGGQGGVQWTMLGASTALALTLSDRIAVRVLPAIALGVFAMAAASWTDAPPVGMFAVLAVFCSMHAVHALFSLSVPDRRDVADAIRLAALPLLGCAIAAVRFPGMEAAALASVWGVGSVLTFAASAAVRGVGFTAVHRPAQVVAATMASVAMSFALPREAIPLAVVAAGACFALTRGWRMSTLSFSILSTLASLSLVGEWLAGTLGGSLTMSPVLTGDLPSLWDASWTLPPAVAACALVAWRLPRLRMASGAVGAVLSGIAVHLAWRHLMGVSDAESFVARGMLDRTGWEVLLAGAAVLAWRLDRRVAAGLALASLAHFGAFTLLAFNPMWSVQAVGPVPLLNMVAVSHGVAIALLWASGRVDLDDGWGRARRVCQMVVVTMLAMGLLRQAFGGSVPALEDVSAPEQLMRSLAAIGLAVGLLLHGIRSGVLDWRAGSLVLMLGAVTKVFVLDASGLDGLARVASFAALGFSLIGVGWLYSRLLPGARARSI